MLTVSAYFEHELNELCRLYQSEKSFKLGLSDLGDKGIVRSSCYLEKMAGLDTHKTSEEWDHIKKIQEIRNVIVHQDGKLHKPKKVVIDYINQIDSLDSKDEEVLIKRGFLAHVVGIYKQYFKLLNESILAKQNMSGRADS